MSLSGILSFILGILRLIWPKKKSVIEKLTAEVLDDLKPLDKEIKNAVHHQKIAMSQHHTDNLNHWDGVRREVLFRRTLRLADYGQAILSSFGYKHPY